MPINQYRKIFSIILSFLLFFCFSLHIFSDDLEKVQILKAFLEKKGNFFLWKLDNFDGEIPWKFQKSTSYIQNLQFQPVFPDSEGFRLESESFPRIFAKEDQFSLLAQAHLEIPDREKIIFIPQTKLNLPQGVPQRGFIWVKSNNYNCKLAAKFQFQKKEWTKSLGELNFTGWKRLEKSFFFFKEYPRLTTRDTFQFQGLFVECTKKQPRGMITLYLDRMSILMEKTSPDYPGSEMEDGWWIKN